MTRNEKLRKLGNAVREYRGWLVRNGQPLTPEMMSALLPNVPAQKFQRALDHFSRPEVDWLELTEWQEPALLPGMQTRPDAHSSGGNAPGTSPTTLPTAGKNSATDRQTVHRQTDRQTRNNKKGDGLRLSDSGPSLAEVAASKTQWAALTSRQNELKAKPRSEWTDREREEWQKNRAALKRLGQKQRAGDFAQVH